MCAEGHAAVATVNTSSHYCAKKGKNLPVSDDCRAGCWSNWGNLYTRVLPTDEGALLGE